MSSGRLPKDVRRALATAGSLGGKKRMAGLSPEERSALGRRAVGVRDHGWCPHCRAEPGVPEHVLDCPALLERRRLP